EQVELAEVEASHVEVCVLGAGGAQDHEPTARAKRVDRLPPGPDRVEDDVEAALTGRQLPRCLRPRRVSVEDPGGGAKLLGPAYFVLRGRGDHDGAPHRRGE